MSKRLWSCWLTSHYKIADLVSINHNSACFVLKQNHISCKFLRADYLLVLGLEELLDVVLGLDVWILFASEILHDFAETLSLFLNLLHNENEGRIVFVDCKRTSWSSRVQVGLVDVKQNAVLRREQHCFICFELTAPFCLETTLNSLHQHYFLEWDPDTASTFDFISLLMLNISERDSILSLGIHSNSKWELNRILISGRASL